MHNSYIGTNGIILKISKNVGSITLNRPEHRNSFNLSIMQEFQNVLEKCESNKNIRAIVVKGAGYIAFCAGDDIKSVRNLVFNQNKKGALKVMSTGYKINYLIKNLKKLYISLWNGIVMGGGMGISIHGIFKKPKTHLPRSKKISR